MVKDYLQVLSNGLKTVCDLILPRSCVACQIRLGREENILCEECFQKVILLKKHISDEWEISERCFDRVHSVYFYDSVVRECIHYMKYEEYTQLAKYMVYLMFEVGGLKVSQHYDYVIPVPLHRVKERERGYNQAYLLCHEISSYLKLKCRNDVMYRTRYTETQTLKTHEQRQNNVKQAFKLNKKLNYHGLRIAIVDDVITTGSTVNSMAQLLKEHGAKRVDIITFAFANVPHI